MLLLTLLVAMGWALRDQQLRSSNLDTIIAASTTTSTSAPPTTTTSATTTITSTPTDTTNTASATTTTTNTSTGPTSTTSAATTTTSTPTDTSSTASQTTTITTTPAETTSRASTSNTTTTTSTTSTFTSTPSTTTGTGATISANTTTVKIVYAAGDLQSINLLREGLPGLFTRQAVQNVTDLELIPYGNATEIKVNTLSEGFLYWHPELQKANITNVYRCPNGEGECETSLIHACAVKVSENDPNIYVPFIGCMSGSNGGMAPEDSSFACSNSTVFMESLRTCALGFDGIVLQHELAEKAKGVTTIPSVFINDEPHPFNVSATVASDFTKLICDALFAEGRLDRDQCEGSSQKSKAIVLPFESLLTPSALVNAPTSSGKASF